MSIENYLNLDSLQCAFWPSHAATMDPRFLPHNSHLNDVRRFAETDPQLRHLAGCPHQHRSSLLDRLPTSAPGIYSLGGGRQTGKSTLLKQ